MRPLEDSRRVWGPRRQKESPSATSVVLKDFVNNTSLLGIQHFLRSKNIVWLIAYLLCVAMSVFQSWSVTVKFVEDFVQNTSLLGIQHFLRNKSVIWLIAYLGCVSMSIVQSWSVTVKYFEQQTFQTSTIASKNLLPFPSVTVCANSVLNESFNKSVIPGFNNSVPKYLVNCSDWRLQSEWHHVKDASKMAAIAYLRGLSNEQRLPIGVDLKKNFIYECKFSGEKCDFSNPKDFNFFSHPYFGNCFIFNPAFEDDDAKLSDLQAELHLIISFNPHDFWLSSNVDPKAILLIHTPGTAPIMESPEVIEVFERDVVKLQMDLKEITVLKKRSFGLPSCVDDTEDSYRKRSRYYTAETPYKYSLEACIASCLQDYGGEECNSINPFLPFQSREYERGKNLKHCRLHHPIHMEACNCPSACHKSEYDVARQIKQKPQIPCADEHEKPEFGDGVEGNQAEIKVVFRRNIYQKVEEQFCYTISDYLGVLGGNISLWIGLCVISLLELVELAIKVTLGCCEPSTKVNPFNKYHHLDNVKQPRTFVKTHIPSYLRKPSRPHFYTG